MPTALASRALAGASDTAKYRNAGLPVRWQYPKRCEPTALDARCQLVVGPTIKGTVPTINS